MKALKILIILFVVLFLYSCTENTMAKNFGGKMEIYLPKNKRLMNATWKEDQLWYLYEEMPLDYNPQTKVFKEKSSYGAFEWTIIFKESK